MNKSKIIVTLVALAALAGLGVVLWRPATTGLAQLRSPLPTPTIEPTKRPIPTPDETGIIRLTPIPTYVPPPTPTPRPWPVGTPFPLPTPAGNPSGTILYMTFANLEVRVHSECTIHAIQVDEAGQPIGEARVLARMEDCGEPSASPDGRYLAVPQGCWEGGCYPIILDLETLDMWPLFGSERAAFGLFYGWHPDNKHVLFSVDGFSADFPFRDGQSWRDAGLWLVNIETDEYSVLAGMNGKGVVNGGAAISPDGAYVAYTDSGETWLVALDGSRRERLDPVGYIQGWSPDGEWILSRGGGVVGKTNVSDERHIEFTTDFTDLAQGPLPGNVLVGTTLAAWSPDGRTVAATHVLVPKEAVTDFNAFEAGNVCLIDVLGGSIRPLLPEGHCLSAAWSPDGSMLVFLSDRSGTVEVWIANADGTGLRQLTNEGPARQFVKYYAPIWISARR